MGKVTAETLRQEIAPTATVLMTALHPDNKAAILDLARAQKAAGGLTIELLDRQTKSGPNEEVRFQLYTELLPQLRDMGLRVGPGTVPNVDRAGRFEDVGCDFIVSLSYNDLLDTHCVETGTVYMGGCCNQYVYQLARRNASRIVKGYHATLDIGTERFEKVWAPSLIATEAEAANPPAVCFTGGIEIPSLGNICKARMEDAGFLHDSRAEKWAYWLNARVPVEVWVGVGSQFNKQVESNNLTGVEDVLRQWYEFLAEKRV